LEVNGIFSEPTSTPCSNKKDRGIKVESDIQTKIKKISQIKLNERKSFLIKK
jgi:hypothetical protein